MNTPQGWNPIGQSAPGLPRHDAPLPGHVSGQSAASGLGGEASATPLPSGGYFPGAIWFGRGFILLLSYLGLPILIPLYPIAGAPAFVAGWFANGMFRSAGMGYDDAMSWAWTVALIVLLPIMRFEIAFADRNPSYRALRHGLRLVLFALGTFYLEAIDQHAPFLIAVLTSAFITVILHFVLRSPLAKLVMYACQHSLWLRKA
jgi:hypothetical protein